MSRVTLTKDQIKKVVDALPEEVDLIGIGEIIFNILDFFGLEDDDVKGVMVLILAARGGVIKSAEFGPDGERGGVHGT